MKSGANLLEPESVKQILAEKKWDNNTKALVTYLYSKFLEAIGNSWEAPKYRITQKIPFLPTEQELDALISGVRKKVATFLRLLKETGLRSGEAWHLKWMNLDFENQTLTLNEPEKHGRPRILKLSSTLIAMLKSMQTENERVFNGTVRQARASFRNYRKRMSFKLKNPRLLRITFHSFRHWKASMEYHKTKDILHVMEMLGHRNIKNTLVYTHLINFESDEWHSKTAKTIEEAQKLVESGFEYICTTP
jgi:integrase